VTAGGLGRFLYPTLRTGRLRFGFDYTVRANRSCRRGWQRPRGCTAAVGSCTAGNRTTARLCNSRLRPGDWKPKGRSRLRKHQDNRNGGIGEASGRANQPRHDGAGQVGDADFKPDVRHPQVPTGAILSDLGLPESIKSRFVLSRQDVSATGVGCRKRNDLGPNEGRTGVDDRAV
jgi:hypothetical protein